MVLSNIVGVLIGFCIGGYLDYFVVPFIGMSISAVCLTGFIILPESPQYLMVNNRADDAQTSLGFYRGLRRSSEQTKSEVFKEEMNSLYDQESASRKSLRWSDFKGAATFRAILISFVLIVGSQLCGTFAIQNYTATIFRDAGSKLEPNMCAIIVGFIQLAGSYLSLVCVDRLGRKVGILLLDACTL